MNGAMKWQKWKWPIVSYCCLAVGLWALLYGFYWQDRTGHQVYWGDALVNWVGDVVMLQWVRSYQELIGGVLTLTAGAFVIFTAWYQRQKVEEDRLAARVQLLVTDLVKAQTRFRKIYVQLRSGEYEEAKASLPTLDLMGDDLSHHSTMLGSWVQYLAMEISRDLEIMARPVEPFRDNLERLADSRNAPRRHVTRATANAVVGYEYFKKVDRLVDGDGNFSAVPASLTDLENRLAQHAKVKADSLYLTQGMFE